MKQFGLSKRERIVNAKEFERVYKEGIIKKKGKVIVHYLPNQLEYARLGVAVGKKMFRSAVARNRIKRIIREAFRLNKHKLPVGLDIIVGVRVRPAGKEKLNINSLISLTEIQTDLLNIFNV